MAGMLPGTESARRRWVRQSSSDAAEARRASSLCLYAGGRGRDLGLGSSSTTVGSSDAWDAKERLDHKLRGQRQLNRHQMTSTRPPPARPHDDARRRGGRSDGRHSAAAPCGVLLQREVLSSRPKIGCRFDWCRGPPAAEAEAECAVCLEELRAGDVMARLPCAHRFHWSCAVPWVQAVSRCPIYRAHVAIGPS